MTASSIPMTGSILGSFLAASTAAAGGGPWISYEDETASRLLGDPAVGAEDVEEKDFAWGDVDQDGDVDLVVVRKQPFSTTGRRRNVLYLNEDGVLVNRTAELASASDVDGDEGFLTPTNDRDVILADVTGDGWLDVVTATTLSADQPKHIGHPRIYVNLGAVGGAWQGFRYEDARIPQLLTGDGTPANPQFNGVAAGDVNGDGAPDLYFVDDDLGGSLAEPDLNDRLLINGGAGFFTDVTAEAMTPEMVESGHGTATAIVDVNLDGHNDVVKCSNLGPPTGTSVTYNDPKNPGFFEVLDFIASNSPTFVAADDLDGDGRPDFVVTDDGADRTALRNIGNGPDGLADFVSVVLPETIGFGGNSVIEDLDGDGRRDIIVTDVDNEIPGCSRTTVFLRNATDGGGIELIAEGPGGLVDTLRTGIHDVAVFDVSGDGVADLVLGRCEGLRVWRGGPRVGIEFGYPAGRPGVVAPDEPATFEVTLEAIGGGAVAEGSGRLHVSMEGGPFVESSLVEIGPGLYEATLPALACLDRARFYLGAELESGIAFTDPPGAPNPSFVALAASDVEIALRDEIEGDVSGWSIESESLLTGEWEQADPNGTFSGGGLAAPEDDATEGPENTMAFVTRNGPPGGAVGADDVDGGPTHLISPVLDLAGADATISYARWFYTNDAGQPGEDRLEVAVSNDGGATWTPVPDQTTTGTDHAWETASFLVGQQIEPTSAVRVRFSTMDVPNDSVTEAGIDDLQVDRYLCAAPCTADLDDDGQVAFDDLLAVLAAWGPCAACPEDLDDDGAVDFLDLLAVLAAWGPCPR